MRGTGCFKHPAYRFGKVGEYFHALLLVNVCSHGGYAFRSCFGMKHERLRAQELLGWSRKHAVQERFDRTCPWCE